MQHYEYEEDGWFSKEDSFPKDKDPFLPDDIVSERLVFNFKFLVFKKLHKNSNGRQNIFFGILSFDILLHDYIFKTF